MYAMSRKIKGAMLLVIAAAIMPLFGQLPVQTQKAEMSIPFGVVPGRLVTVGEYLLFIDDEKPEASFAVARTGMRNLSVAAEIITIETLKPIRDRGGERSALSFRMTKPLDAQPFADWYKATAEAAAAAAPPAEKEKEKEADKKEAAKKEVVIPTITYQAKHDHFPRGGCSGRLILEPTRVVFESITEIDHSRQWDLKDIKELKRDNPYNIKIVPFMGNEYNLQLQGKGMDSNEFKALVHRITSARISP